MNLRQRLWTAARIVLISSLVLGAFGAWQADYYQNRIGEPLRRELAFHDGSPYVVAGNSSHEVLTLHPHAGGSMERAGVRNGDIVLSLGRNGFYRSMQKNRGAKFSFTVVDGGNGAPIEERPERQITVEVPQLTATP